MASADSNPTPPEIIRNLFRECREFMRAVLPRRAGRTMREQDTKKSVLRRLFDWEGISFVTLSVVGLAFLSIPHAYLKAKICFIGASIALVIKVSLGAKTVYAQILVALLGSLVAGWCVIHINNWVASLQIEEAQKSDELERRALSVRSKSSPPSVGTPLLKSERKADPKSPKPVPPVIQIAPSFGNLQKRTLDLAGKIDRLVQHRFDQRTKGPTPPTPQSLTDWNRSNDDEFRSDCWDEIKSIREEFATLHIRDEQLDGIVLKYEKSLQRRNSEPQTQWWSTYMNIFDMQSIAQRLRIMAGQLPQ